MSIFEEVFNAMGGDPERCCQWWEVMRTMRGDEFAVLCEIAGLNAGESLIVEGSTWARVRARAALVDVRLDGYRVVQEWGTLGVRLVRL